MSQLPISRILPKAQDIRAMLDAAVNPLHDLETRARAWQNYESDRWIEACVDRGLAISSALDALRGDLFLSARKQFCIRMECLGRFPNGSSWEK